MHAKFSFFSRRDTRANVLGPHLVAQAYTEKRNSKIKDFVIKWRRLVVYRCRAARKDYSGRCSFSNISRFYARWISYKTIDAEFCELLDDQVVKLRPHREKQNKFGGFAHFHLFAKCLESF